MVEESFIDKVVEVLETAKIDGAIHPFESLRDLITLIFQIHLDETISSV